MDLIVPNDGYDVHQKDGYGVALENTIGGRLVGRRNRSVFCISPR